MRTCIGRDFYWHHLINYYDDYDFLETTALASFSFPEGNGYGQGKLTGTIVNTYNENGIITPGTSFEPIAPLALVPITSPRVEKSSNVLTVRYYDIKGREVQKVENNLKGGYETTTIGYTFTGQPETVTHTHTDGTNSLTETYTYSYDGRDRVDSVKHTLNNGTEVLMAVNAYDSHGRLSSTTHNGKNNLKTTYGYNIRDWMTSMGNSLYSQTLTYGYGGNINTQQWTQDSKTRKYTYTYDGLDRLTSAAYTGDGNYATNYTYDKNGNIKTLQRYDVSLVDNLAYTYNGNQLTKVEDTTSNTFGFANGASTTNEYTYDGNGNLTKDSNKGITNISYNSLSLPSVVTFGNGSAITYTYSADGKKLRTVHVIGNTTTQTDYCGNVIYENGTAKLLLTEAGYVDLTDNSYHFYIKDHLGNNRIVADANGTVEESNQYYPFGLSYANANSNVQPYKYNGKELDTKGGLNWYDYGARHYDAALGRWHVVDPLGEKYYSSSPFVYCNNNPLRFIDPNGKDGWDIVVGYGIGFVTNVIPGTGFLRDTYTPTDASDYNNALKGMDNASMVVGAAMIVDGGINITTGGTIATAGIAVTAGSAGTGVVVGAPVAAGGATIAGIGTIEIGAGTLLMSNAETNKSAGYDRGKKSSSKSSNELPQYSKEPPGDLVKMRGNQGWKDPKTGNIWKRDMKHKDHYDISDPKTGKKIKEVDYNGNQIWPNGPKNKNKK